MYSSMFDISWFLGKNRKEMTDEMILQYVKKWDTNIFEIIYDKRNQKLFSYLMTILNYNKEEANQILWDTFIALYEYNKTHTVDNCKSFLYTTAHNRAVDHIKKLSEEYNHEAIKDIKIDEADIQLKENINLYFKNGLVNKYLHMLHVTERQALHLYYYEDKSYDEIATIIWSNKNTVWQNISQAKKKLKELVEREWTKDLMI